MEEVDNNTKVVLQLLVRMAIQVVQEVEVVTTEAHLEAILDIIAKAEEQEAQATLAAALSRLLL